jgi:hypothetical protein
MKGCIYKLNITTQFQPWLESTSTKGNMYVWEILWRKSWTSWCTTSCHRKLFSSILQIVVPRNYPCAIWDLISRFDMEKKQAIMKGKTSPGPCFVFFACPWVWQDSNGPWKQLHSSAESSRITRRKEDLSHPTHLPTAIKRMHRYQSRSMKSCNSGKPPQGLCMWGKIAHRCCRSANVAPELLRLVHKCAFPCQWIGAFCLPHETWTSWGYDTPKDPHITESLWGNPSHLGGAF